MTADSSPPPALPAAAVPQRQGSRYPVVFAAAVAGREKRALGNAFALAAFGVNLVRLPPGTWSSQRHWHTRQDELVYVLEGEVVLVTEAGEQLMQAGMVVGFPAGSGNGHHLINRSDHDVVYLEVGDRHPGDLVHYPDLDLIARLLPGTAEYCHRDGRPFEE